LVAHALAHWRVERTMDAVDVLDAMPRDAFREPRHALVYGVVLADAGRARESEAMLDVVERDLLQPEEGLLLEGAHRNNHMIGTAQTLR
jgi:hypothetical protein